MEFHISRKSRDFYQFDEKLFSLNGNALFANFHAVRMFAQKMNKKRNLLDYPELTVRAGDINAMGLIDEILHYVIQLYREDVDPKVFEVAYEMLCETIGQASVKKTLKEFVQEFPPVAVYQNKVSVEAYLENATEGISNYVIELEEMLMLWIANVNPAFSPFKELFNDSDLEKNTRYPEMIQEMTWFFRDQLPFGPEFEPLVELLRSPAVAVPHSLSGQLEYIRKKWGHLLGKYLYQLLSSLDFIREEEKMSFMGPGPTRVYDYSALDSDYERYSQDSDWMPKVVMMAKNTYVWLDQLSKQYNQEIKTLDQVPDQELDHLAEWGFTCLWLIGLWERSKASKTIKQIMGNPDAVASAYSLMDYVIADDLGGESAYHNLKERAWQRGIRMAGDMVPNHVGIDAKWVVEHPDWFISLDYSPFPSYTFNGTDLSHDGRVGIYLEDHYYERTDAAVVFKRVDHHSGSAKYIYHGNDGTSMPWNDTAQINFLNAEAREAVIQTILHVARKFPVIRFDAAMTLAKKHIQRLWFPEPGTGGAIASRAEHGLTRDDFEKQIPEEFWREVVDRVAAEAPDTLLLAEAFWLLEGYFVRTLGMHRVYNSAFMNMLKNEENSKYRDVIKKTLEFDPQILKRFVNFMNNPDEDTAVAQFGKDDKYFGVCILLSTMPGLPMFGHGQIEGYTEKYGMEFRRAYWNETPDQWLVERHKREIFPILRKRYLFAGAENFYLYDCFSPEGHVNEDILAYSNQVGQEKSLVIYHNKFADAQGWIKMSVGFAVKKGDSKSVQQKTLGEGLGLINTHDSYCIFRNSITGLEFIRNSNELHEQGLFVNLGAFKYHVFIDFREVHDQDHRYSTLAEYLNGRGVPNIEEAMKEIVLKPIHEPFKQLVNAERYQQWLKWRLLKPNTQVDEEGLDCMAKQWNNLAKSMSRYLNTQPDLDVFVEKNLLTCKTLLAFPQLSSSYADSLKKIVDDLANELQEREECWAVLFGWMIMRQMGELSEEENIAMVARSWMDEFLFGKLMAAAFEDAGFSDEDAWWAVLLVNILIAHEDAYMTPLAEMPLYDRIRELLQAADVQQYLQVNRYQEVLWFNQERFESLIFWTKLLSFVVTLVDNKGDEIDLEKSIVQFDLLMTAMEKSEYRVDKLLQGIKEHNKL